MQRLTIFTSFLLPWLTFCVLSTFCEYPTRHHQDRNNQKLTQELTMQRQKRSTRNDNVNTLGGEKSHHLFSSQRKFHQTENNFIKNGSSKSSPIFIDNKSYQNEKMEYNSNMVHCTSPVGSMDGSVLVESESGEFMDFTTLQWQIGLGETLCYRFVPSRKDDRNSYGNEMDKFKRGPTIRVSYLSIRNVYPISNSYTFKLAKITPDCVCDCPGGSNICNTYTNRCNNRKGCINYYKDAVGSNGCFFNFLSLTSALCCALDVQPLDESTENEKSENVNYYHQTRQRNGNNYRAIQLSVPTAIAHFRVVHRDADDNVIDSRDYNIDLNSGTSVDWEVSLQLSSTGPSNILPPNWYFMQIGDEITSNSTYLYGNVPINNLNEWSLDKLGWYKTSRRRRNMSRRMQKIVDSNFHQTKNDQVVAHTFSQIKRALNVKVKNCAGNAHSYTFPNRYIGYDQLESARKINDMYPFIKSVKIWRRHVEVVHRTSPLLLLTMQHRSKVDVTMRFQKSQLEDFNGLLFIDSDSNSNLNLTLFNAKGSIHGTVLGYNSSQAIHITIGNVVKKRFNTLIRLTGMISCVPPRGQVTINLHPYGTSNNKSEHLNLRKVIPCREDGMRQFRELNTETHIRLSKGGYRMGEMGTKDNDCFICLESWTYWLSPFNWSNNVWTSTRIVIIAIVLIFSCCLIGLFAKICSCLKWCCCSS